MCIINFSALHSRCYPTQQAHLCRLSTSYFVYSKLNYKFIVYQRKSRRFLPRITTSRADHILPSRPWSLSRRNRWRRKSNLRKRWSTSVLPAPTGPTRTTRVLTTARSAGASRSSNRTWSSRRSTSGCCRDIPRRPDGWKWGTRKRKHRR